MCTFANLPITKTELISFDRFEREIHIDFQFHKMWKKIEETNIQTLRIEMRSVDFYAFRLFYIFVVVYMNCLEQITNDVKLSSFNERITHESIVITILFIDRMYAIDVIVCKSIFLFFFFFFFFLYPFRFAVERCRSLHFGIYQI